jgi:Ca2+-dependent lipid-binding protein
LKKMDVFGKNDVFVMLDLNGDSSDVRQTQTITDGGSAPAWANGAGETHVFNPDETPQSVCISVFEEDVGPASDLIGTRAIMLVDQLNPEADWKSASWFEITDKNGAVSGEIHVSFKWAVPETPQMKRSWQLRVVVLECSNLKSMDTFDKNDVYVQLAVDNATVQRTTTIDGGGAAPKWDNGIGEQFVFALPSPPPALGVEVYDEDVNADDLIGKHVMELGSTLGSTPWSTEIWLPLENATNKSTGRTRCEVFWEPQAEETRRPTKLSELGIPRGTSQAMLPLCYGLIIGGGGLLTVAGIAAKLGPESTKLWLMSAMGSLLIKVVLVDPIKVCLTAAVIQWGESYLHGDKMLQSVKDKANALIDTGSHLLHLRDPVSEPQAAARVPKRLSSLP